MRRLMTKGMTAGIVAMLVMSSSSVGAFAVDATSGATQAAANSPKPAPTANVPKPVAKPVPKPAPKTAKPMVKPKGETTVVEVPTYIGKEYADGTYRGVFVDGGAQQVGLQFVLKNDKIESIKFRVLNYKDTNYLKEEQPVIVALKGQYEEAIQHMVGKRVQEATKLLKTSKELAKDAKVGVDTYSGATIRSSKLAMAMRDGLNRGVYQAAAMENYDDGTYRGVFIDGGYQQVGITFELKDNVVQNIKYRKLFFKEVDYLKDQSPKIVNNTKQFNDLIQYLVGKDIRVFDETLRFPSAVVTNEGSGVDAVSAATLRSNKVLSAIYDGLGRGVYSYKGEGVPSAALFSKKYEDGTYRGYFYDGGAQQVGIQFKLKNNVVSDIKLRTLSYKGTDYLKAAPLTKEAAITMQYNSLISYLNEKNIAKASDLYKPSYVKDIKAGPDTVSGATLRSSKAVSAIADALNHGTYN